MKLSQSKKQSTTNSYNKSTSTGNTNTNNHTNIGSNSYRNNHNSNTNNRTNTVTNTVTNIGNLNIQSSSKMNMELFEIREPKKSFFANWFQKPSNSFVFRMIVIVSLAIATACGGALIYYLLTYQETKLFRQNFELITDEAIRKINNYFERVEAAGVVIVKEYSHVFPDKETWPNVGWTGFSETTAALLGMKLGRTIAVAPIVEQSNKQQFEDFAYDYFASNPRIPSSTGEKPFGRGIFAGNPIYEVPYQLDRTGVTLWGSPYTFYYPILEIGDVSVLPVERLVMYNLHSDPAVGRLLDQVYDCSQAYIAEHGTSVGHKCSYLTDLLEILLIPDTQLTAKMVHVQPIFPENDKDTMTGIISVNVDWLDILEEALPDRQSGIDCLVETATTKFSMTFENGKAKGLSYGDVTDKRFNQYKNSKSIQLQGSNSNRSSDITVTFYPKYEFYSNYRTDTPLYACIIVVLVEVILSITFFVYDYYMKRESSLHEQILDAKKQFVRFISHEVRTPLNSVSMGLSLLTGELVAAIENGTFTILEKNDSGSSRKSPEVLIKGWKKLLAELSVNVDDASVVLNDLLNYDKMERENSKIDVAAVDIKRLLEKTYHLFEVPAENVGVNLVLDLHELTMPHDIESHITVDPFDQIPPLFSLRCLGDETRLAQVLRNIVSNAVKFTPAAGTVIIKAQRITNGLPSVGPLIDDQGNEIISKHRRAGAIRISVTDSGMGLDQAQANEIFGEGRKFNPRQLYGGQGSGLGLFIAKSLVERHRGVIEARSEGHGKGTTFVIDLPAYCIPDAVLEISPSDLESLSSNDKKSDPVRSFDEKSVSILNGDEQDLTLKGINVLVVDDAASNRKMLVRLLQKQECICNEAINGSEAVEIYLSKEYPPFDLVLMDFEMPVMNGPSATKKLRELGCTTLIVGITGNVLPADVKFFKDHGADEVLPKPLNIEKLFEVWVSRGKVRRLISDCAITRSDIRLSESVGQPLVNISTNHIENANHSITNHSITNHSITNTIRKKFSKTNMILPEEFTNSSHSHG